MTRKSTLLALVLVLSTAWATAQMRPGQPGTQQPGTQPGMQQPGGMPPTGMDASTQSGMGRNEQQQPQQQPKVDDATLERMVHEQLASRPELSHVQVSAKDGEVRLEGSVPTKEDRKQAKKLAQAVPGVRWVKEKLKVNPSAGASATSTTGAESAGQPNTGGTMGAATASGAGASTSNVQTAESQNPRSSVSGNPSQQGSQAASGAALGRAPCACSPSGTAAPTPLPGTSGTVGSSTAGTSTQAGSAIGSTSTAAPAGTTAQTGIETRTTTPGVNQQQPDTACACPPETASPGAAAAGVSGAGATSGAAAAGAQPRTPPEAIGQSSAAGQTGSQAGTATETTGQAGTSMAAGSLDLAGQIQTALRNEPTLANDNIQVSATDNEVTLSGTVSDKDHKDTAKRIAESFAAGRKIVDRLTASPK